MDSGRASKSRTVGELPRAERQQLMQETAEIVAAHQLVEEHGREAAIRIALLVRSMCGDLRPYGREIDDLAELIQMRRLVEHERDASGNPMRPRVAARKIAATTDLRAANITERAFVERLVRKYKKLAIDVALRGALFAGTPH
jgi:hypothetical protein